mmetsp:Transcript_26714/g.63539  ORF Transcript_26714/g.63539 Transcript_26714/m.63539 type:complete len:141 (+) Transcript_26714:693-1115(+)|eukprot:CAMPEP_0175855660 /NCGR_PEP_ID=MMETSP0107_2-20121207/28047_1 /TAXON_ID=195067 ORGANISM="Goniomonas pacifica, Strain CCMP1869" /NCGR_SAMPLE_ID=MMETSP0107_2 /ASSEMBLY_ACC=CAM_ASM_000203 /LENGTH=140 /DNA_ID=CAMNT_0017171641 /DNA_START=267 /DNA_END=689 /DNA_ORIENTATION=-
MTPHCITRHRRACDESCQFKEHHDFFDPETDPPENFEPGGNRLATFLLYLHAADEGGETYFSDIDLWLTAQTGDAVLFYDMKKDGDVDRKTMHAGMPPVKGEKWVMTKWIHERPYQSSGRSLTDEEIYANLQDGDGHADA